jgi:SAM-dependent methyltransferase
MRFPSPNNKAAAEWHRAQADFYGPLTVDFLRNFGISRGMNVLDIGCGAGDVSYMLATLVGPKGRVLGIDQSLEMVSAAKSRQIASRVTNVEFLQDDATQISYTQEFDAITGRFVLMYLRTASVVLRQLSRSVKPGGLIIFVEPDYSGARSSEPLAVSEHMLKTIEEILRSSGADTRMGLKLHRTFIEAGLGAPALALSARLGGGLDFPGYKMAADFLKLLLPPTGRHDFGSFAGLDQKTIERRLRDEVTESGGVIVFPSLIAACARIS